MKLAIVTPNINTQLYLSRLITAHKKFEVIWSANNHLSALSLCEKEPPNILLLDIAIIDNDNNITKSIKAFRKIATLIVSNSSTDQYDAVFKALCAGVIDVINLPPAKSPFCCLAEIRLLNKLNTIGILSGYFDCNDVKQTDINVFRHRNIPANNLVAIGSSTGGPSALAEILSGLPEIFAAPIVIVQHVDELFVPGLVRWLNEKSKLPVVLAKAGDHLEAGKVYIACTSNHLVLNKEQQLSYCDEPIDVFYRPSVDVFFMSLAENSKHSITAILLTGMGSDGARGLLKLREKGAYTVAQDSFTSVVYGMPKVAVEMGAAIDVLPIGMIANAITDVINTEAATLS